MFYEFHFNRQIVDDNYINMVIWLFSDTGYFISDHTAPDKLAINTFASPTKSGTKVGFLFYRQWESSFYPLIKDTPDNLRRFIEKGELPNQIDGGKLFGTCCEFSRLADESSADELVAELMGLAKAKDFPLERLATTK